MTIRCPKTIRPSSPQNPGLSVVRGYCFRMPWLRRLLAAADYLDRGAISIANGIVSLNGDLIIAGYGDFELAVAELDAAARLLP